MNRTERMRRRRRRRRLNFVLFTLLTVLLTILLIGLLRLPYLDNQVDTEPKIGGGNSSGAHNEPNDETQSGEDPNDVIDAEEPNNEGNQKDGLIQQPSERVQQPITLSFAGDTMAAGKVAPILQEKGYMYPWEEAKPFLSETDLAMVNLETAVSLKDGEPAEKQFAFLSHPDLLKGANWAGIDLVSLANNHALDYGPAAFLDTLSHLKQYDIAYVGGGANHAEAYQRQDFVIKEQTIGFLGFSKVLPSVSWYAAENRPGLASGYQEEEVYKRIAEAAEETDLTIVYIHWGKEMADEPEPRDREMAYKMIDAGADVVIGAHPHVLQGLEYYKGKLIAYSLGNFIFTMSRHELGRQTGVLQLTIDPDGQQSARLIPMVIEHGAVKLADEETGASILERMKRLSKGGKWAGQQFQLE